MNLEDLRRDSLGKTAAYFPKDGPESKLVPVTYHDHCIKAFYLTCEAVEQLEKSKAVINPGNTSILAVGMWFLSIEAFINTLLRIACRFKGESFDDYKKRDIGPRLTSLLDMLGVHKNAFYSSGILPRFEEFKAFRNEMFHDRTGESELVFNKTKFSSAPYLANQVDALQGAVISLEVFYALRHVYQGLDLMPDIIVRKNDSFGHVKLDILYKDLLRPFFSRVLMKHGLTSELVLEPTLVTLEVSKIAIAGEVKVIVKAIQDEEYKFLPNEADTSIGAQLFAEIQSKIDLNTAEQFGLGNYFVTNS